jgi:hypothetical protein
MVGGWIDLDVDPLSRPRLTMTVQNSSALAIRKVCGYVFRVDDASLAGRFMPIPVLRPGEATTSLTHPTYLDPHRLVLVFDDDGGIRWRKYANEP